MNLSQPLFLTPPPGAAEQLKHLAAQLASKYVHHALVTQEDLTTVGNALWRALDCDEAFAAAKEAAGTQVLPVMLETSDHLPWECVRHPEHGFLGIHEQFTLSRRQHLEKTSVPLRKGPLRVLLFTSLPDDLDAEGARLDMEDEQAQVLEALAPYVADGIVHLETPDDGTFAALQKHLKEDEYHVVFLSGHGTFHHQPHTGEAPFGVFQFEGEGGGSDFVRDADIAQAFVGSYVQCVVLSACQSAKATHAPDLEGEGPGDAWLNAGLARALPLPEDGFFRLAMDLKAERRAALEELAGFSLVEVEFERRLNAPLYLCSPLVREWLQSRSLSLVEGNTSVAAAEYLEWFFENQQDTLPVALAVYQAFKTARLGERGRRFALGSIVKYFHRVGLHRTLLDEWLPEL